MEQVTIAALSTPLGVSALAVVRVSGPEVLTLLRALLGDSIMVPKPRQMKRARVVDPRSGEEIDDLLYCYFAGPSSYTGEDMLELFPHGNPVLVHRLLDAMTSFLGFATLCLGNSRGGLSWQESSTWYRPKRWASCCMPRRKASWPTPAACFRGACRTKWQPLQNK